MQIKQGEAEILFDPVPPPNENKNSSDQSIKKHLLT